jgi:hypothetical protein
LEDAYKTYVGRVLKEATVAVVDETSEKEEKVLAEGAVKKVKGSVKTGNNQERIVEESVMDQQDVKMQTANLLTESEKERMRRIAGI